MFDRIFLSPKVKRSVIISNKHGIYQLPQKLLNYLRLRILEYQEIPEKSQKIIAQGSVFLPTSKFFQYSQKTHEKQKLGFSCITLFLRVCIKHFVHDCFWKQFFVSNLPPALLNFFFFFFFLTILVHSKAFNSFNLKLGQLICKKELNFVLLGNYFPDLFTKV